MTHGRFDWEAMKGGGYGWREMKDGFAAMRDGWRVIIGG